MSENNELARTSDFAIPQGYICTVDISTVEGKKNVANALNAATPLKNFVDKKITVIDILTTPGIRAVSETECTNTYLVLKDGTVLFSQSDGVARAARTFVGLWTNNDGICDFGDGIDVKCIETPLNNGNTMKTLVMA